MARRRIVIDSDDDIDDFPSLRLSPPPTTVARKLSRPTPTQASASPGTPRPYSEVSAVAPITAIRRRKLGKINNDVSLLRPWGETPGSLLDDKLSCTMTPEIGLPQDNSVEPRQPTQPRYGTGLKTKRTRRVSVLPAHKSGELSTKDASVSEDITLREDNKGDGHQDLIRSIIYVVGKNCKGENKDTPNDTRGTNDKGGNARGTDSGSNSGLTRESDSEASEFHDSSSNADISLGSLNDSFSISPIRREVTVEPGVRRAEKRLELKRRKGRSSIKSQITASSYTDDESSVFFSAEESLPDRIPDTISQLRLPSSIKSAAQTLQQDKDNRPETPSKESPAKPQPSRLLSPTKLLPNIPQTPHRPSSDAFWNQMIVDNWNMEHSPQKRLFAPDGVEKSRTSQAAETSGKNLPKGATTSPLKKVQTAASKKKEAKQQFQKAKHSMAEEFLAELDSTITKGELGRLAAATGGVRIEWTNKLNTTAGRANWRRETMRPKATAVTIIAHDRSAASASASASTNSAPFASRVLHHASIELAEKVIDDEHRLLNVIAHEFCHLANFMVSGVTGNPHGKEFKIWAAQCSRHFGDRGIQVTTKHAYEIDFKYIWTCEECATDFKRHSKSIDPSRHRCGACKGVLSQTKPVPRGRVRPTTDGCASGVKVMPGPSEYQKFMKEHMTTIRQENPGSPQKLIMKLVADKWSKAKELKKAASNLRIEDQNAAEAEKVSEQETAPQAKRGKDKEPYMDQLDKVFVDLTLD